MRGLTLGQVARGVGLSPSFLSMLERGQADISLTRFTRLAEFYAIKPSELLLDADDKRGRVNLMSSESGLAVDRGKGITYRLLSQDRFGMQVVHVLFEPKSGFQDVLAHNGFDVCWIIRGEVILLYGDEAYTVKRGELVSFEASVPHAFRNETPHTAELLGFVAPPYW